jgi:hypothetical protein
VVVGLKLYQQTYNLSIGSWGSNIAIAGQSCIW